MPKIAVLADKCIGCQLCVKACPYQAITLENRPERKFRLAIIDLNLCNYCGACVEACKFSAIILDKESKEGIKSIPPLDKNSYRGIWVYAEQRHNVLAPVVFELLAKGSDLAKDLDVPLSAVLLGYQIKNQTKELIANGADKVYLFDDPLFAEFQDDPYADALAQLIREEKPEIVLMGATNIGRSFASRVAAKISTGLTADCTGLEIDLPARNLLQTRPAFGGNIMATIVTAEHRPQMATVRHKVFKRTVPDYSRSGEVLLRKVDTKNLHQRTKFLEFSQDLTSRVNLADADIIVSGGRGLGKAEGFRLIEELAGILGGAVGASRATVDAGWIPYSHQVGQTGRTVAPKIYIACGISGAIQHLVGMGSSDIIVAINRDPEAPMMKVATYALEGDIYEIIPLIIKEIKRIKSGTNPLETTLTG